MILLLLLTYLPPATDTLRENDTTWGRMPLVARSFFVSQPETEVRLAKSAGAVAQHSRAGFCSEPKPTILKERCDLIDVNNYYDEYSRHVFCQLLFYDWHSGDGRHHLRAWRMVKPGSADKQSIQQPAILPRYDHARRLWVSEWLDGDIWRRVEAVAFRESWTQYDPELTEREFLPKEKRRELRLK